MKLGLKASVRATGEVRFLVVAWLPLVKHLYHAGAMVAVRLWSASEGQRVT